jgi:hypothetical protein
VPRLAFLTHGDHAALDAAIDACLARTERTLYTRWRGYQFPRARPLQQPLTDTSSPSDRLRRARVFWDRTAQPRSLLMSRLERITDHIATQETQLFGDYELMLSNLLEAKSQFRKVVLIDPAGAKKLKEDEGQAITQLVVVEGKRSQLSAAKSAAASKGSAEGVAVAPPSPRVTIDPLRIVGGHKRKHSQAAPKTITSLVAPKTITSK